MSEAPQSRPAETFSRQLPAAWVLVGIGAVCLGASVLLTAFRSQSRFIPFETPGISNGSPREAAVRAKTAIVPREIAGGNGWTLELERTEPALERGAWDRLRISVSGDERTIDLTPGAAIDVGGKNYRVSVVRTWRGLLPTQDGRPGASVSMFHGDEPVVENLLVVEGQRVKIERGPTLTLQWHPDAETCRRAAAAPGMDEQSARWGVADDGRVHWFESFVPGTGVTLDDGTVVLLERFLPRGDSAAGADKEPVLIVRWGAGDDAERIRVAGASDEPPILAQYPGQDRLEFCLHAYTAGRAWTVLGSPEDRAGPVELESGERWQPDGAAYGLRLEQVLPSAAPVTEANSPFFEAVLESGEDRLRVRQGEAVRAGDALLRYMRQPDYASTAFRMRVDGGSGRSDAFVLYPHERHSFKLEGATWLLHHGDVRPGEGLVLRRRAEGVRWFRLAGLVLFVAGLVAVMMRRPAAH